MPAAKTDDAAARLRAACEGKPGNAACAVKAVDVVAALAGKTDPVAVALRDGAAAALDGVRNPDALVVYQMAADLTRALAAGG